MDHAVHYRTSDGATRFEEAGSLDAAVAMVERLRNEQGVSEVRVYRQVPIEFKTYYKAVVAEGSSTPAPTAAPAPSGDDTPPAPQAPQTPPPGAMPLGPSTPAPSAPPAAGGKDGDGDGEGDTSRRGSLFSRG